MHAQKKLDPENTKSRRSLVVTVGLVAAPGYGRTAIEADLKSRGELHLTATLGRVEDAVAVPRPPDVWICDASLDAGLLDCAAEARPVIRFTYASRPGDRVAEVIALPNDRLGLVDALRIVGDRARQLGLSGRLARRTVANRPESIAPIAGGGIERLIIAICAANGGPAMVRQVLGGLPPDGPAVLLVQRIGGPHVHGLLKSLQRSTGLSVGLAADGQEVRTGHVYVASPGRHLLVQRHQTGYRLRCQEGPPVNHCRPSADLLLSSMATAVGRFGIGVVMSGVGVDGADGLLAMRLSGGATLVQDEATSLAPSMPRAALQEGGAERVVPLEKLAPEILRACGRLMPRKHI